LTAMARNLAETTPARRLRRAITTPAGCRPVKHQQPLSVYLGGPEGIRYPRQLTGVRRDRRRAPAAAAGARPVGGASGPFRAALKLYRKFAQTWPAAGPGRSP